MAQVPQIHIQVHPPERRNTHRSTICSGCSSSCCCCCCAHSLGGVIGALTASNIEIVRDRSTSDKKVANSVVMIYWLLVVLSIISTISIMFPSIWNVLLERKPGPKLTDIEDVIQIFILVISLPIIQLFASVVLYIGIAILMSGDKRRMAFKITNKITIGTVIGTVIGGLLMVVVLASLLASL